MPITEKQRENRRKHIGSSDLPALLGCDPRGKNAYDLWLEKTGRLDESEPNQAMLAGTHFEDGVRQWASDELGPMIRNQYRAFSDAYLGANIDAIVRETGEPVEVKTSGLFGPVTADWGEFLTDCVPDNVILQAHAHMLCTEKDVCHVPVFLGGRGFGRYMVRRSDKLVLLIIEKCKSFWECCVEADVAPANEIPCLDVVRRARRLPNSVISIPASLRLEAEAAAALRKMAEQRDEQAKAAILAAMGDAEAANYDDGEGAVTFYEQSRRSIDTKRLQAEEPELAAKYGKETRYRVLRTKKGSVHVE